MHQLMAMQISPLGHTCNSRTHTVYNSQVRPSDVLREQLVMALSVDIEPQMAALSLGEDTILVRMDKLEKAIEDERAIVGNRLQNIEKALEKLQEKLEEMVK